MSHAYDFNNVFSPLTHDEIVRCSDGDASYSTSQIDDAQAIVCPAPADAPRPQVLHSTHGEPSAVWSYLDATGAVLGYVCRFDPPNGRKQILPLTLWRGERGVRWRWKSWPEPRPLYGLDRLGAAPTAAVVVVEGEKCADAARTVFPHSAVVTSAGGADAVHKADWRALTGRRVLIWPDADAPGSKYASTVAEMLGLVRAADIRIVNARALAARTHDGAAREPLNGWDVADALNEGWSPEALAVAAEEASEPVHAGSQEDLVEPLDPWSHPDLSLLGTGRRAAPTFPLSLLGSVWASWVERRAAGASTPVDYVACALLASAGALLANVRWPLAGASWSEPPVIWMGLVGSPSSGKSPAMDAVFGLIDRIEDRMAAGFEDERRLYEMKREEAEARREAWKADVKAAVKGDGLPPLLPATAEAPEPPVRPRIRVADSTMEKLGALAAVLPRGLLLVRDELAGWLGAFDRYGGGGSDRAFALEMYGGRSYVVDRMKNAEPLRVRHLSVGIVGGIQPDKLSTGVLGGPDDGLAARFLWAWPDTLPRFNLAREITDDSTARDAFERLSTLTMGSDGLGNPEPVVLRLEPGAEDGLERFAREMAERSHEAGGAFAGALGKARGHALRLAIVIEFLWWAGEIGGPEPVQISERAMTAACRLVDGYFVPMAERVYGDAAIPTPERHAMTLARHLRRAQVKSFNARKLRREVGGVLRDTAAMDSACATLEEAGLIKAIQAKRVGRPSRNYIVNAEVQGTTHE